MYRGVSATGVRKIVQTGLVRPPGIDTGQRARFGLFAVLVVVWLSTSAAQGFAAGPEILHYGNGPEAVDVVVRGRLLSVYAARVPANTVLDYLRNIGGPTYSVLEPLTRPVTLTEHRETMETILSKMLVGYNYLLQLRQGRVSHVRVLRMVPGRGYKTPPPVETREEWTRTEMADSVEK